MSTQNLPQLNSFGYKVQEILANNWTGGRVTYKATSLKDNCPVIIKQFRFATANNSWSGYKAIEKEIKALRQLDHPQIPKYRESFDPGDGLCFVQEYVNGIPLNCLEIELERIPDIAIAILQILVYLQQQHPAIIHRDIKPENILIDGKGRIYLIDFGFASAASNQSVAGSSTVLGTIGFIPPEQLFGKKLNLSSDIYSLGVTLFCLIAKLKTSEISSLIDSRFSLPIEEYLIDSISTDWIYWLKKSTNFHSEDRYENAKYCLQDVSKGIKKIQINLPKNIEYSYKLESRESSSSNIFHIVGVFISALLMFVGCMGTAITSIPYYAVLTLSASCCFLYFYLKLSFFSY